MKMANERIMEKVQPSYSRRPQPFRDTSTMDDHQEEQQQQSQPEPRRQAVRAAEGRAGEVAQAFGGAQILNESQTVGSGNLVSL